MLVLVTGGARSGKSSFAEQYAACLGGNGTYIATAQVYDEEMQDRVDRHQQQRDDSGFAWTTVEEPYDLTGVLKRYAQGGGGPHSPSVILVDCLTLWLSNWLLRYEQEGDMEHLVSACMDELLQVVRHWSTTEDSPQGTASAYHAQPTLIFVTNEVGSGIVPEYKLGRQFRDLAGKLNQRLAALCDQVFLVTAGIPIELKSRAFSLEKVRANGR